MTMFNYSLNMKWCRLIWATLSVPRIYGSAAAPRVCTLHGSNYIIIDSLFIFSVSKLFLDAASYDGEIWHADA